MANNDNQPSTSSSWSFLEDDAAIQSEESQDEADGMREQLVRYLREPRVPMDTNVLEFWKTHKGIYPDLAQLARRYLSTPPGSAASERVFSKAKHVLKDTRLKMKPGNLEMNLLLKLALRSFDFTT